MLSCTRLGLMRRQSHSGNDRSLMNQVFEDTRHLVQSAVDGYNVCIFAYGQTGALPVAAMLAAYSAGRSLAAQPHCILPLSHCWFLLQTSAWLRVILLNQACEQLMRMARMLMNNLGFVGLSICMCAHELTHQAGLCRLRQDAHHLRRRGRPGHHAARHQRALCDPGAGRREVHLQRVMLHAGALPG